MGIVHASGYIQPVYCSEEKIVHDKKNPCKLALPALKSMAWEGYQRGGPIGPGYPIELRELLVLGRLSVEARMLCFGVTSPECMVLLD